MEELASLLASPPQALAADCAGPIDLPDAALSAGEVERFWADDRAMLISCAGKHAALRQFYESRDAGLAGK